MESIEYKTNCKLTTAQFLDLLQRTWLDQRRPADDLNCLTGMLQNSNLCVSAWHNNLLVGIARSITDFHYACYLSDLAVDKNFHSHGIGKRLQSITQKQLGPRCKLILVSAPAASSYYPHIGYQQNTNCWILEPDQTIKDE